MRSNNVVALLAVLFLTAIGLATDGRLNAQKLAKGNNQFALDLYTKLKNAPGNLFVSPYSVSTALAMTYAGARGQTEKNMAATLHFDLSPEQLHPAFASLMHGIQKDVSEGGNQLNIANALWAQMGEKYLESFLELTRRYYGAGFREVDFRRAAETARLTINKWVEEQTKGKITDLIKGGMLDEASLVLTNAIYFKGVWAAQFKKDQTRDDPFTVTLDKVVTVPIMHQTSEFGYLQGEGFQALELPYAGERLSMIVLLPAREDGLPALEKQLSCKNLDHWIAGLRKQEVILSLPRFKMTCEFRLDETLKAMGMANAFSPGADFSGMDGKRELFIGAVVHKAFVDVNEEGTEAAAATAVIMLRSAQGAHHAPVFRADHPFLFLIRDVRTGSILFMGRIVNPNAG